MDHLTSTNPELERAAAKTYPGMAHWAGSGPAGETCGKCLNYGDIGDDGGSRIKRNRCLKYYAMMDRVGGVIPAGTAACRHFEKAVGTT